MNGIKYAKYIRLLSTGKTRAGQQWAFAGTTDSGASNFKESFKITTELVRFLRKRFTTANPVNEGSAKMEPFRKCPPGA